jgi:hypothetical protein
MPSGRSELWLRFAPRPLADGRALHLLLRFTLEIADLGGLARDEREYRLEMARKRAIADSSQCDGGVRQPLVATLWVLADLVRQGWAVRVREARLEIRRPLAAKEPDDNQRARIREQLHAARGEQLREPPVQAFIREMETRRLYRGHFVSIFSLMRDGVEFAAQLRDLRDGLLKRVQVIQPYIQFVNGDERCQFTALKLADVWRYFRHTWSNPYQSIPGRSMMMLMRDAAARFHPVIGIAAVSSAAVAIGPRDDAIGWTPKAFLEALRKRHRRSSSLLEWIEQAVDRRIRSIYKVDLLSDEVLRLGELRRPTAETLKRLGEEASRERAKHYRLMKGADYKRTSRSAKNTDWMTRAKTHLFRSKRAEELADLLSIRLAFGGSEVRRSVGGVQALLTSKHGAQAVARLVRRIKAEKIGSAIADLTVCGAVPPYSEVLGGKLVAMLIASPEVRLEYRRRYQKSESVIASAIAGRAVVKSPELAFVGTTSLFGRRPSQYDRIAVPTGETGETVRYEYLGRTEGVGTFQFSERTVRELELLLAQSSDGIRVNSVFGEGVNPRLRKIREALDFLGLPTSELLQHGTARLVYGLRLARNLREYLLDLNASPKYFMADSEPSETTKRIAAWWAERWLARRVERKDILERVEQHNFIHPIQHGARVPLPGDPQQPGLFEEW